MELPDEAHAEKPRPASRHCGAELRLKSVRAMEFPLYYRTLYRPQGKTNWQTQQVWSCNAGGACTNVVRGDLEKQPHDEK